MALYNITNDSLLAKYLDPPEVDALNTIRRTETHAPGSAIVTHGERNRDLFVIDQGSVGVFVLNREGDEIRVSTLGQGEVIGEVNFVIPLRRTATIRAAEPTTVSRYPYPELLTLLGGNPLLAARLFAAINDALAEKVVRTIQKKVEK